jgi:hypothetical protein
MLKVRQLDLFDSYPPGRREKISLQNMQKRPGGLIKHKDHSAEMQLTRMVFFL